MGSMDRRDFLKTLGFLPAVPIVAQIPRPVRAAVERWADLFPEQDSDTYEVRWDVWRQGWVCLARRGAGTPKEYFYCELLDAKPGEQEIEMFLMCADMAFKRAGFLKNEVS